MGWYSVTFVIISYYDRKMFFRWRLNNVAWSDITLNVRGNETGSSIRFVLRSGTASIDDIILHDFPCGSCFLLRFIAKYFMAENLYSFFTKSDFHLCIKTPAISREVVINHLFTEHNYAWKKSALESQLREKKRVCKLMHDAYSSADIKII